MLKKTCILLLAVIMLFSLSELSFAADTDNHTVTVTVSAVNEVAITGGNINLTINSATAGSEPNDDTDNTCSLAWTTNEASKKVTVETTTSAAQLFGLTVEATGVAGGTSGGVITLTDGAAASDFVTAISQTVGSCTLDYTASATTADGTGTDTHTVVYTITDV